ncbi:cytochrome P450 9e2 [Agrilus planipennis]|uniref:Cytochrome P450 9e2 n=1 Tax=Agrilus planipennis TaxID=224129 RepID=A0A1W4XUU8_AGRPL|nr:cytochrome P450 9e2 [Agrilus planipennis]
MFLLLVLAVLALLYYLYIKPLWYWKSRNVPFENPVPVFGNMMKPTFKLEHIITVIQRMYNNSKDSPYFGFLNFQNPILVLKDPELIKKVTVKDFDVFPRHRAMADEKIDPLWSKNLFSVQEVQKWRHLRATLSPTFTANKLRMMFDLMQECAKNFTKHYLQQEDEVVEVDIKDAFRRYATDVIATTAFGITCNSVKDRNNEFYIMGLDVSNFNGIRALKFFLYSSSPAICKILRLGIFGKTVSNFFRKIVSDNIRMREEQSIVRPDMIHLLMEARKGKMKKEKPEPVDLDVDSFAAVEESEMVNKEASWQMEITDEDITAQAMVFFLGGFDTTSSMMSFAIAELAVNPEIQQRLREEINDVVERTGGKIKYEDINRMKYFDMVISETLRKWALAVFLDRQAVKPYTISQENGKPALRIEEGDVIWIPVYSIHRDPKYYPDPEKFDPERFSDERKHEIKPFTFLPFGTGPRNCIGSRFALLEAKIALFNILIHFEVVPTSKVTLPLKLDEKLFMPQIEGGFIFSLKKIKTSFGDYLIS